MIKKITLDKVTSYKKSSSLETDKKINIIYGLNGSGKSTFSNYLSNIDNKIFDECLIEGLEIENEIYVYNQKFISENFYEAENLKGIFTLSKRNKEAREKIILAEKEIKKIEVDRKIKTEELTKESERILLKQEAAKNTVWEIKKKYTGGDRVLEFCLEGFKNDGNKLLLFVETLKKSEFEPIVTIEQIKEDVQFISGDNAKNISPIPTITFEEQKIEKKLIFVKQIVGNENSSISDLVNKLGNSDWVKEGLQYIEPEIKTTNEICPFCQEKTISEKLLKNIKEYFDEFYENDLTELKELYSKYNSEIKLIPLKSDFDNNPKLKSQFKEFENNYNNLLNILNSNLKLIATKIKSPSIPIILMDSSKAINDIQAISNLVNENIQIHNEKIENKPKAFEKIKNDFWELMRWEYDQTISNLISEKEISKKIIESYNSEIENIDKNIINYQKIISEQQELTANIDDSISSINNGLLELGIDDIKILKHSDILYKIVRTGSDYKIFQTLSEGEKMIISFLYFIEQCKGKKNIIDPNKKKIIVIDDPISSLSHIYVFNVGRLIHNEFLRTENYEQVFILTHSLYFFYELADTNKDRRNEKQKLFRLQKNVTGSEILEMKYEEIQNDYQSYWYIVKDDAQPPALIANCMRNIIEYFYNFVEKKDLNNVFQKPELKANRFDAFNRYMNRESHSLGQNIFDYKEFNYQDFKEAFELVFKETGYENHYKKMIS